MHWCYGVAQCLVTCRDVSRSNISNEELQLDETDYMQLMADMEQSFLDAMLQDEAAFLSHFEAQELNSLVTFFMCTCALLRSECSS